MPNAGIRLRLRQNPALATAWFGLGQIRLEQHRPEEAATALKRAIEIQPDSDGYHYELGRRWKSQGIREKR